MDATVGNMIYTMFLKHPNFDYSYLREAFIELLVGYKQMALKGEITLEAPLIDEIPSIPLDMNPVIISKSAIVPLFIFTFNACNF